jgi:hypothetical protein
MQRTVLELVEGFSAIGHPRPTFWPEAGLDSNKIVSNILKYNLIEIKIFTTIDDYERIVMSGFSVSCDQRRTTNPPMDSRSTGPSAPLVYASNKKDVL